MNVVSVENKRERFSVMGSNNKGNKKKSTDDKNEKKSKLVSAIKDMPLVDKVAITITIGSMLVAMFVNVYSSLIVLHDMRRDIAEIKDNYVTRDQFNDLSKRVGGHRK